MTRGYRKNYEDGYAEGLRVGKAREMSAVDYERARIHREEVEPLREALSMIRDAHPAILRMRWAQRIARAALRAADERGR